MRTNWYDQIDVYYNYYLILRVNLLNWESIWICKTPWLVLIDTTHTTKYANLHHADPSKRRTTFKLNDETTVFLHYLHNAAALIFRAYLVTFAITFHHQLSESVKNLWANWSRANIWIRREFAAYLVNIFYSFQARFSELFVWMFGIFYNFGGYNILEFFMHFVLVWHLFKTELRSWR